jgi:hypothetical protein
MKGRLCYESAFGGTMAASALDVLELGYEQEIRIVRFH